MKGSLAPLSAWLKRTTAAVRTLRWRGAGASRAVTAWTTGADSAMVRIDPPTPGGRPRLSLAQRAATPVPRDWRAQAKGSTPVLVLSTAERHLLTLDRPQVPDAELPLAVRWPAATAQELDPEQLLCMPLALPASNAAAREQLMVVSASIEPVRQKLAALRQAGIDARHVDIIDSALLGMMRLHTDPHEACVALAPAGSSLCIGLMWQGRFCALRTLALPGGYPSDDRDMADSLALNIQRTVDLFERQATLLAIRQVLLALPALPQPVGSAIAAALPMPARVLRIEDCLDVDAAAAPLIAKDDDLQALAWVAAFRLLGPVPLRAAAGDEAASGGERDEVWSTAIAPTPGPVTAPSAAPGPAPGRESRPVSTGEPVAGGRQPARATDDWALLP